VVVTAVLYQHYITISPRKNGPDMSAREPLDGQAGLNPIEWDAKPSCLLQNTLVDDRNIQTVTAREVSNGIE